MKLGALKSAIRSTPKIKGKLFFGPFVMEKGALIEALDGHFTEGKAQETYLKVTEDGFLEWDKPDGVE